MSDAQIEFQCESCGNDICFPLSEAGTIQECPECFDYVDVPTAQSGDADRQTRLKAKHVHVASANKQLALDFEFGFPHPRWDDFYQSILEHVPESQLDEVFHEAATLWLNELVPHLDGYHVSESDGFLLLSKSSPADADFTLAFCEEALRKISTFLEEVAAEDDGFGKHVVLAFADIETYYSYVNHFYPDGESGGSGGMFIDDGYGHIVCNVDSPHRTIAHELTHSCLRHLPIPAWLNEGITQIVEDKIMDESWFRPDAESLQRMRSYWSQHSMDGFWSGESFNSSDEGQTLSYQLARLIVMRLYADHAKQFWPFVRSAERTDSGYSAFENEFGESLDAMVAEYISEAH